MPISSTSAGMQHEFEALVSQGKARARSVKARNLLRNSRFRGPRKAERLLLPHVRGHAILRDPRGPGSCSSTITVYAFH